MPLLSRLRSLSFFYLPQSTNLFPISLRHGIWKNTPVVDGTLLKESPSNSIRSKRFSHVPLLTGSTTDEALVLYNGQDMDIVDWIRKELGDLCSFRYLDDETKSPYQHDATNQIWRRDIEELLKVYLKRYGKRVDDVLDNEVRRLVVRDVMGNFVSKCGVNTLLVLLDLYAQR